LIINHEEELLRSLQLGAAADWQEILNVKPELRNLDIVEMPGLIAGYHELRAYAERVSVNGSNTTKTPTLSSPKMRLEERCTKEKLQGGVALPENRTCSPSVMIPGELAFKLYDTYGLEENVIQEIARVEGFQVDINGFIHLLNEARVHTKESFRSEADTEQLMEIFNQLVKHDLKFTEDTLKYSYTKENGKYVFPSVECEVKAIVVKGKLVAEVGPETQCSIVLDCSNFYHEAGGQASDTGQLVTKNGTQFHITDVTNSGGYLLHHGYVSKEGNLSMVSSCIIYYHTPTAFPLI
jgi:alanyl-tRNA synthetase